MKRLAVSFLLVVVCCAEPARNPSTSPRGDSAPAGDNGGAGDSETGDWDPGPRTGLAGLIVVAESAYSAWAGADLYDRPGSLDIDPGYWFAVVEQNSVCELRASRFRGDIPYCEPPCTGDTFCTPSLKCETQPQVRSAGPISLEGLTVSTTLHPTASGYRDVDTFPMANAFAPGAKVTASAAGDVLPGFTIEARGVPAIEMTSSTRAIIRDGEDLTVTWKSDSGGDLVEVYLTPWVHIFTHMYVRCVTQDTGSVTIPWQMLQHFPYDDECGRGECGSRAHIARFSRGSVEVAAGTIELRLMSIRDFQSDRPR